MFFITIVLLPISLSLFGLIAIAKNSNERNQYEYDTVSRELVIRDLAI